MAMKLCTFLTSIISLGEMQHWLWPLCAFSSFASHDVGDGSLHSRSLCYSLRSDETSRSWHLGLVGSWNLLILLLAAWTLGASGELLEAALGLLNCF